MKALKLPGTALDTEISTGIADKILTPMFYSGGLVLSQLIQLTGLEGHVIQNWVKRGYLSPPKQKKYTRRQLCRILNINILKDIFTLERTAQILGYINGILDDDSDDIIDDSDLYSYFMDCLASMGQLQTDEISDIIGEITVSFQSSIPNAKERLNKVLSIMLTAYHAQQIRQKALDMFAQLDNK